MSVRVSIDAIVPDAICERIGLSFEVRKKSDLFSFLQGGIYVWAKILL